MDIKMIVTDLDGTFLRTDKSVSAYSQQIIRQCREKGIVFVIATARPVRAVKSFLPFLSCDAAIYHNGAVVRLGEKMICACDKVSLLAYTTEEAGGFVGCTIGMYASSHGTDSKNYADYVSFTCSGAEE
mgnify:CR=1 FL=1